MVVAGFLFLAFVLGSGYIGVPLWREPRRAGDSPVHWRTRRRLKFLDRLPVWTPFAFMLVIGLGWLLSRYG